ncbi:MAG: flagellar filament capping protein FliD [Phycisphaeraceae bacterium]|nr:MAG: flagellar filament capping protein FliD [Phycisphaeraceae bacterium]
MSGISTGVGLISGINTGSLINQMLSIEAKPKQFAQSRVFGLQLQQTAYLDLNSRLSALKTIANKFRTAKTLQSKQATTSDGSVLKATASNSAAQGTYQFIVDRLVSTQQMLSKGFANKDSTSVGATTLTFETAAGGLVRDTALADLNGGNGVTRGKIVVTDSVGGTQTIDLSTAGTVSEVLDAINGASGLAVTARVEGGRFVISDKAGGSITVADAVGSTTATSLGIAGTGTGSIAGAIVYSIGEDTALGSLNDGNGVFISDAIGAARSDFRITIDGSTNVQVNIGPKYNSGGTQTEGAASTVGQVLTRINEALAAAGFADIQASIAPDGSRLQIIDDQGTRTIAITETGSGSTAKDLGILTPSPATGTLTGSRVLAGMNSTLTRNINGGSGLGSDGAIDFTLRDGSTFNLTLAADSTIDDIISAIQNASGTLAGGGPKVSVTMNASGTGLQIKDNTTGSSQLIISGAAATSLGIDTTGTSAATVSGKNLQHAYVTASTLVSTLNQGKGIGTGVFEIRDSTGGTVDIDIGTDTKNVGQLIAEINSSASGAGLRVRARINANGDGIEIYENIPDGQTPGSSKIKITDRSGGVAAALRIAGEAKDVGPENKIDGSYERTVEIDADDTLQDVANKINSAGIQLAASIVNDGTGSKPFRLSLTSKTSGSAGRVLFDSGTLDLGLSTIDKGSDARIIFGGSNAASGLLLTSSSNTFSNVVTGLTIDAVGVSENPVRISVSQNTDSIVTEIRAFIDAFNTVLTRIDDQSKYNQETKTKGALLGDQTSQSLRRSLLTTIQSKAIGASGTYDDLADLGVRVGSGSRLELDEERLRNALATDPASVEQVLAGYTQGDAEQYEDLGNGIKVKIQNPEGPFTVLGLAGKIERLANTYIDSVSGILTGRKRSIDTQIEFQNKRIAEIDVRLASRRQVLQAQFVAMEQAIAQLQSQQSAISQIGLLG